ncbi:DUF443 family protein [Enterococcus sp. 5H]|uniref:DUF443 family protein n=1 Tax=Enterococcus sp. 5H TaxID=1229490 RepID=UPI003FA53B6A
MKSQIIENTNNKRYRLFVKENKKYIIDSDTNIISIIFPWLIWLFALNGYEIEDIQSLQIDKNKKRRKKRWSSAYFLRFKCSNDSDNTF